MFVVRLSGSLGRAGAVRVGCSSIAAGCRCRSTQPPPLYTTTSIRLPGGVEAPTFTTPPPPAETEDADNSSNTTIKTRSKQQRHLVLIPSPSLVCDSSEWLPAATSLFEKKEVDDYGSLAVTTLPLPGFGTAGEFAPDTPTAEWYTAWIANALARISEASDDGDVEIDVVAAGHSAGLVLKAAATEDTFPSQTVKTATLVTPTFTGPLPTVFGRVMSPALIDAGGPAMMCNLFEALYRAPLLGSIMHDKFTATAWVSKQLSAHVYANPESFMTDAVVERKRSFARADRPRKMAVAFVTGRVDMFDGDMEDAAATAAVAEANGCKVGLVFAESTPPGARAAMEALRAAMPATTPFRSVPGALLAHEEHPAEVAEAIISTIAEHRGDAEGEGQYEGAHTISNGSEDAAGDGLLVAADADVSNSDADEMDSTRPFIEVEAHVKEVLAERVVPNVQLDGGDVHYSRMDSDTGVVVLELAGACVDCPSSTVTMRFMIKNVIMHYVPEVTDVVQLGEDDYLD